MEQRILFKAQTTRAYKSKKKKTDVKQMVQRL